MFKLSSKIGSFFLVSAFLLILFQKGIAGEPGKPAQEKQAATVNGIPILVSHLKEAVRNALVNLGHGELPPERMAEIRNEAMENLIERELVIQKAREENISPNSLVQREVYEKAVATEEEMKAYYQTHLDEFMKPEGVRLRHLLVKVDPAASNAEWKAAYKKAVDLQKRTAGGESFEVLIKQFSDPESKYFGGDLSEQYKGRMAMAEFDQAAFQIKVNEVSPPIQTIYGFSLIQAVEKIPPAALSFEEANKTVIEGKVIQEKVNVRSKAWINELKSRAEIKLFQID